MCVHLFVRAGGIESCWVRKFSICEDFSSVCAFVRAGGIELYWVRKFSICENFSSECVCKSWMHRIILGEEIFHL